MVGKGLVNSIILELLAYAAINMVPLALPLAMLLASIMTFGTLGERYELLAIKSSGVSLLRFMRPLIVLALLITLLAFYLADQVVTVTNSKFAALLTSVKRNVRDDHQEGFSQTTGATASRSTAETSKPTPWKTS